MRSLLAFFTVLPVRDATLEDAARSAYLLPLVGLVTGAAGGGVLLLAYALPPGVAATLALSAVLLAAGLHHSDGVLDVGDALMVRGAPERRREVLKDTRVGIGGIGALFVVYAPALAALTALAGASTARAALALVAGEVAARSVMLLMLVFGEPAERRSSSVAFVRALEGNRRTAGLALACLAPLLLLLPFGLAGVVGALAVLLFVVGALRVANAAFGGIGGDIVGATGEVGRTVVLVALSATI
ncbi:MAG: adenosylcobinamide-GDP ribazoletransferase [Actinomycetes bacterium]